MSEHMAVFSAMSERLRFVIPIEHDVSKTVAQCCSVWKQVRITRRGIAIYTDGAGESGGDVFQGAEAPPTR